MCSGPLLGRVLDTSIHAFLYVSCIHDMLVTCTAQQLDRTGQGEKNLPTTVHGGIMALCLKPLIWCMSKGVGVLWGLCLCLSSGCGEQRAVARYTFYCPDPRMQPAQIHTSWHTHRWGWTEQILHLKRFPAGLWTEVIRIRTEIMCKVLDWQGNLWPKRSTSGSWNCRWICQFKADWCCKRSSE